MRLNRTVLATATAAAVCLGGAPAAAAAAAPAPPPPPTAQPVSSTTATVTGSWSDAYGHRGAINGSITPQSITVAGPNQAMVLNTDVALRAEGTPLATQQSVPIPVTAGAVGTTAADPIPVPAGCPVLHLVLGPLNLNLLGLTIVLQQVTLDIVAVPGPGNLLGNLLCGLLNLLNGLGVLPPA